jgi:hypothetical protein
MENNVNILVISGLNYQNIPDLPPSIDIGCHNSENNVTLSGPAEDMEIYLETLKKQNIFVKTVNSNGIAYHSRMVRKQAEFVKKFIDKVNLNLVLWSNILEIIMNSIFIRLYRILKNDLQNGCRLLYQRKIGIVI